MAPARRSSISVSPCSMSSTIRGSEGLNHSARARREMLPARIHTTAGGLRCGASALRNPRPWSRSLPDVPARTARSLCLQRPVTRCRRRTSLAGDRQDRMVSLGGGELQAGPDVLGLQVWVVGENLRLADARRQKIQHVFDPDPHAANARAAAALIRVEGDAIHADKVRCLGTHVKMHRIGLLPSSIWRVRRKLALARVSAAVGG